MPGGVVRHPARLVPVRIACDRERSGGHWSARRGHGDAAVPVDEQYGALSSPAAASPGGTLPVMTSPSRRVVRVSARYRSARPRGDACSIPAGFDDYHENEVSVWFDAEALSV
jgi:hypothetical protein